MIKVANQKIKQLENILWDIEKRFIELNNIIYGETDES